MKNIGARLGFRGTCHEEYGSASLLGETWKSEEGRREMVWDRVRMPLWRQLPRIEDATGYHVYKELAARKRKSI